MNKVTEPLQRDPVYGVSLAAWVLIPAVLLALRWTNPLSFYRCPFKVWTGLPCLSCGITRLLHSLADGAPMQAFFYHPLGFLLFVAALSYLPARHLMSGAFSPWEMLRSQKVTWLSAAAVLVQANWVYLVLAGV